MHINSFLNLEKELFLKLEGKIFSQGSAKKNVVTNDNSLSKKIFVVIKKMRSLLRNWLMFFYWSHANHITLDKSRLEKNCCIFASFFFVKIIPNAYLSPFLKEVVFKNCLFLDITVILFCFCLFVCLFVFFIRDSFWYLWWI